MMNTLRFTHLLQRERAKVQRRIQDIEVVLGAIRQLERPSLGPVRGPSLAGRRKIARAQRARWRKIRAKAA